MNVDAGDCVRLRLADAFTEVEGGGLRDPVGDARATPIVPLAGFLLDKTMTLGDTPFMASVTLRGACREGRRSTGASPRPRPAATGMAISFAS